MPHRPRKTRCTQPRATNKCLKLLVVPVPVGSLAAAKWILLSRQLLCFPSSFARHVETLFRASVPLPPGWTNQPASQLAHPSANQPMPCPSRCQAKRKTHSPRKLALPKCPRAPLQLELPRTVDQATRHPISRTTMKPKDKLPRACWTRSGQSSILALFTCNTVCPNCPNWHMESELGRDTC